MEQPLSTTDRVVIDPRIMLGKPVIRDTRITVEPIVRKLGEGAAEAEILDGHSRPTQPDIRAALGYAADAVAHKQTILLP